MQNTETSFVLTCGTSLRMSLCWRQLQRELGLRAGHTFHDLDDRQQAIVRSFHRRLWPQGPQKMGREELEDLLQAFDPVAWSPAHLGQLSAELAAIHLLGCEYPGPASVHLIHGASTPECAQLTRALLQQPGLLRFPDARAPRVELVAVEQLDSRHSEGYAMGLRNLARALGRLPKAERRIYCLAGGFKAMVGHVVARACWEHAQGWNTRACFLGQDARSLLPLPMGFEPEPVVLADRHVA